MTTAYTSLLGLALPVTGELTGTWGSVVNNSITSLLDTAIAGVATASVTSGDWTLSDIDGASSDARAAIIRPTGSPGVGVSRNIIAPSQSKAYIIQNESNGPVVIKGSATTGVTIAAGKTTLVAWNGTDFIEIVPSLSTTATAANGLNSATTTVAVNSATAPTTGQVLTATSGSAATWQTPTSSGGSVTSVAATVPSFLSVSGSPITTSGTLAISYSGTALPVLNGGTGVTTSTGSGNNVLSTSPTLVTPILGTPTSGTLTSCTGLPLTTGVTGTLPVANGGNGTSTPSISSGTGISVSGSWPNYTITNTASSLTGQTNTTNTALGYNAYVGTTGFITSIGVFAYNSSASGDKNTYVGTFAGYGNTSGSSNTGIGHQALKAITTGNYNVAVGTNALLATDSGTTNIGIGQEALASNNGGSGNIAIGNAAMSSLSGVSNNNIVIGTSALSFNTSGTGNIAIGYSASSSSYTVSSEVNIYNGVTTARFQGAASSWSFVSDARDKTNITDLSVGLAFVNQLQPRLFEWDLRKSEVDKGKKASGFIAQEVLAVMESENAMYTQLVSTADEEQYTMAQTNLIPILVNAIKELSARVAALEASNG